MNEWAFGLHLTLTHCEGYGQCHARLDCKHFANVNDKEIINLVINKTLS